MSNNSENLVLLADAVARNAGIVLSLPSAGIVRHFKSRFLGDSDEGIWVEAESEALPHLKQLIEMQQAVAVSFKGTVIRMGFASTPLKLEEAYQVNAQTSAPAVLLAKPTEVKGIQRRSAYRVRVQSSDELSLRAWTIAEHVQLHDRPVASSEIKVQLSDISTGGVGVRLDATDPKIRKLIPDQRLRLTLKIKEDEELILEGRLRGSMKATDSGPKVTGIVFKKLENDVEGRRTLATITRIVGELQREEVRRSRLGLAG